MNKNLLKKYASLINEEKIKTFANKNNIQITSEETNYIIDILHNDLDNLLDKKNTYLESKRHLFSDELYKKILEYYETYSFYLD